MKEKKPSKNKKVKPVKKTPTQFTIDLDIKGLVVFVGLGVLTALVIFYLGVIFGKASRDPAAVIAAKSDQSGVQSVSEEKITSKDLEIYNMRANEEEVDDLRNESESALADAERLISETKKQFDSDEKESKEPPKKAAQTASSQQSTAQKQWPDKTPPKKLQGEVYTVQVFATKDKDKADRIARLLRQKEFDAYLVEANIENQKIFRVRVGRKSKSEITVLNEKLKSVIGGMGMKSRIIQIN